MRGLKDALKIASRKHDLICLQLKDPIEQQLPNTGLIKIKDAETGIITWIDTSSKKVRNAYLAASRKKADALQKFFCSQWDRSMPLIDTHKNYIQPLTYII